MDLLERVKNIASLNSSEIIEVRRYIHKHPELSFAEHNTSAFIRKKLEEIGIEQIEIKAGTGLVALIEGKNPNKKVIALRADMDALPINEENDKPYKSVNAGVMHACGHDVHTACLIGAAKILFSLKDEFEGTVKLIFQPGEERLPGGASIMIKEGALENPSPVSIVGQHVMPLLPAGKIGFRGGLYMASTDELYLNIYGKGGHGAMPHLNIDPVLITSHLIIALQQLVSRIANPATPTVLSFGKVIADGSTNIIPNKVYVEGTFRTLNEEWRETAHKKMKYLAEKLAESMGGTCDFEIRKGYPFLKNDVALTERAKKYATEFLGINNVIDLDIWMAAEDFAYYSQLMPACFYRLGTRNESKGINSTVHTPTFDIDEDAIETGSGLMGWIALRELQFQDSEIY